MKSDETIDGLKSEITRLNNIIDDLIGISYDVDGNMQVSYIDINTYLLFEKIFNLEDIREDIITSELEKRNPRLELSYQTEKDGTKRYWYIDRINNRVFSSNSTSDKETIYSHNNSIK